MRKIPRYIFDGRGKSAGEMLVVHRESVNAASGHVRRVFMTFLIFAIYFLLSVLMTNHQQLLMETPLKLPILQVPVPLLWFYSCGPFVLWGFHLYLLLQMHILAIKLLRFNEYVHAMGGKDVVCSQKDALYPFLFTHAYLGDHHSGLLRFLLRLSIALSITILPIFVLLATQVMFIPYHSVLITSLNRLAIFLDLLAIIWFWFLLPKDTKPKLMHLWRSLYLFGGALCLCVSIFMAAIPDERADIWWDEQNSYLPLNEWLVSMSWETVKTQTPFRRNLYLPSLVAFKEQASDELLAASFMLKNGKMADASKAVNAPLDVTGRDLSYADFTGATMFDADFSRAVLKKTIFREADLSGSKFILASLEETVFQGAELNYVSFLGSILKEADFSGSICNHAAFTGADLEDVKFYGVDLIGASFEGSYCEKTKFIATNLFLAKFEGAYFRGNENKFEYCNLENSPFTCCNLYNVSMVGTVFVRSEKPLCIFPSERCVKQLNRKKWKSGFNQVASAIDGLSLDHRNDLRKAIYEPYKRFLAGDAVVSPAKSYEFNKMFEQLEKLADRNDWIAYGLVNTAIRTKNGRLCLAFSLSTKPAIKNVRDNDPKVAAGLNEVVSNHQGL